MDIDNLRDNCQRVYCFGLGFVQVVMTSELRFHFYNDSLKTVSEEEIHDHRYGFTSSVLKGGLINTTYKYTSKETYFQGLQVMKTNCKEEGKEISLPFRDLEIDTKEFYPPGSTYKMSPDVFHTVKNTGPTITQVVRDATVKEKAKIIYRKDDQLVCPFSVSNQDPWEVVYDVLKN